MLAPSDDCSVLILTHGVCHRSLKAQFLHASASRIKRAMRRRPHASTDTNGVAVLQNPVKQHILLDKMDNVSRAGCTIIHKYVLAS